MSSNIFQPSSKLICGISVREDDGSLSPSAFNDNPSAAMLSKSFQASEFPRDKVISPPARSGFVRLAFRDGRSEAGMTQLSAALLPVEQLRKRGGSLLKTRVAMIPKTKTKIKKKTKTEHNADLLNQKLKMPKIVPRAKKDHQDSNNKYQPPTGH